MSKLLCWIHTDACMTHDARCTCTCLLGLVVLLNLEHSTLNHFCTSVNLLLVTCESEKFIIRSLTALAAARLNGFITVYLLRPTSTSKSIRIVPHYLIVMLPKGWVDFLMQYCSLWRTCSAYAFEENCASNGIHWYVNPSLWVHRLSVLIATICQICGNISEVKI